MSMRRGQARILKPLLASSSAARFSPTRLRNLHHQKGPSLASVVERSTGHSLPPSPLSSIRRPLQTLQDKQSGVVVKIYPSTVSIQCSAKGLADEYHFDHVWLRDICTEANSLDQHTQQKLFHTSDIHIPLQDDNNGLLHQ
jgi:hypothetical protein